MTPHDEPQLKLIYVESLIQDFAFESTAAWALVHKLWPTIEELPEEDGYTRYRIKITPFANILGAIMCGDHNAVFHTGTGNEQTLTLVGMCSAVTSRFVPGYMLTKIEPDISFNAVVPIGASVIMYAKMLRGTFGKRALAFELRARIEGSEKELFPAPRTLTMFKIPDSKTPVES